MEWWPEIAYIVLALGLVALLAIRLPGTNSISTESIDDFLRAWYNEDKEAPEKKLERNTLTIVYPSAGMLQVGKHWMKLFPFREEGHSLYLESAKIRELGSDHTELLQLFDHMQRRYINARLQAI